MLKTRGSGGSEEDVVVVREGAHGRVMKASGQVYDDRVHALTKLLDKERQHFAASGRLHPILDAPVHPVDLPTTAHETAEAAPIVPNVKIEPVARRVLHVSEAHLAVDASSDEDDGENGTLVVYRVVTEGDAQHAGSAAAGASGAGDGDDVEGDTGEDDSDWSSTDDEEDLKRELERIQQERQAADRMEERVREADERDAQRATVLRGNPLLHQGDAVDGEGAGVDAAGAATAARSWTSETAFRNQTKHKPAPRAKRFINDPLRSDFQRNFMRRFVS